MKIAKHEKTNIHSVGAVETKTFTFAEQLYLASGEKLGPVTLAYETYGSLNKEKSNAILILHALSGDAHAAGVHAGDNDTGWWEELIGPGKAFDTHRYFIICSNVVGGCKGSTGPSSLNPATGNLTPWIFPSSRWPIWWKRKGILSIIWALTNSSAWQGVPWAACRFCNGFPLIRNA